MNFKRYHVSKNLLATLTENYAIDASGNINSNSSFMYYTAPCEANETYTFSLDSGLSGNFVRIHAFNGDTWIEQLIGVSITNAPFTVTTPASTTNLKISITKDAKAYHTMLNVGEAALPYEPYGNTWHNTPHYIHSTSTDTITTPAVLYPTDTTATVGLKGQAVQSSVPSPTSPVMPQETGERTGNLLPSPAPETKSNNGITVRSDGAGRYYVSGTAENDAYITFNISPFLIPKSVATDGNGTFSMFNTKIYTNDAVKLEFYNQGTFIDNWGLISKNRTSTNYTAMANKTIDTVGIFVKSGSTVDFQISPEFTNDGVLPSEYEPWGIKIPISSASTTTPVYLGEVETTRKIRKLVLTGEESWNTYRSNYYITVSDYYRMYDIGSHLSVCSHYPGIQVITIPEMHYGLGGLVDGSTHTAWNGNIVFNPSPMISSLTDWKAFLVQQYAAGTPVTVWYVLANEETGIVNEPLMKIGKYADTVSGISIPTIAGANTLSVDTTLQPSEVTVNYKGWHPIQNVHEAENGQWD